MKKQTIVACQINGFFIGVFGGSTIWAKGRKDWPSIYSFDDEGAALVFIKQQFPASRIKDLYLINLPVGEDAMTIFGIRYSYVSQFLEPADQSSLTPLERAKPVATLIALPQEQKARVTAVG